MAALREALSGKSRCFAPFAWEALPSLVNVTAASQWWTDATLCRRLLLDLIGATQAQAAVVDILHPVEQRQLSGPSSLQELADDPLDNAVVAAAIYKLRNLAGTMPMPVIAALPRFGDGSNDIAEDVVCDIAGAAMSTGVQAVLIVGGNADGPVARRAKRLAENFDLPVIVIGDDGLAREVTFDGRVSFEAAVQVGAILTPGDVSLKWSLAEIKRFGSSS